MGLKDDFNHWPLGRQLQVLFICASFFICLILVVITKFQLDWLRTKVTENSRETVRERILVQMEALAIVEGRYLQSEFSNYISFASHLKETDEIFNNFNQDMYDKNPFKTGEIYADNKLAGDQKVYDYGVYYSKYGNSDSDVIAIANIESCFNPIYPTMYQTEYLWYYQGYEEKETFVQYPGTVISTGYTPVVREWYYKAYDNSTTIIITEPYTDSAYTSTWVVTMSQAILNNKLEVHGVAGVDVTLNTITSKTSRIKILNSGFALLVSSGGMILTLPDSWKTSDTSASIRIFDTIYTGISETEWDTIKNSSDNSRHKFTDVNGTEYYLVKQEISPLFDSDTVTHYLLLCADKYEMEESTRSIDKKFDDTYDLLFWITIAFGIAIFLSIIVLIYFVSRKYASQFKSVEKVFGKVIRRGLFPRITRGMDYKKLEMNSRGIETLVEACKDKLNAIDDSEYNFSSYNWGLTRPNDYLLYNEWSHELYPYNYYLDKSMPWRETLPNLTKILG